MYLYLLLFYYSLINMKSTWANFNNEFLVLP